MTDVTGAAIGLVALGAGATSVWLSVEIHRLRRRLAAVAEAARQCAHAVNGLASQTVAEPLPSDEWSEHDFVPTPVESEDAFEAPRGWQRVH